MTSQAGVDQPSRKRWMLPKTKRVELSVAAYDFQKRRTYTLHAALLPHCDPVEPRQVKRGQEAS